MLANDAKSDIWKKKKNSLRWTDDHSQEELELEATEESTIFWEPWRWLTKTYETYGLRATLDECPRSRYQWIQAVLLVERFKFVPKPFEARR
jgi:hypothetical protein